MPSSLEYGPMTERSVFLEALEQKDPAARAAYLDQACAGRPAFRERVEELLRSHVEAEHFLEVPALEQMAAADRSLAYLAPPRAAESLGRLDHYEVLEVVGRGGAGVVLKARDSKLQRIVAIKALAPRLVASPAARARFVHEAQAAAAVRDDHVVAIHDVNDEGPVPYLVMEYISGITLEERLRQDRPLELEEVLRIGRQIAAGLAAAHAQGLTHRDIKPANILLENSVQRVKITDFGLARLGEGGSPAGKKGSDPLNLGGQTPFLPSANSKVLAGTPQYMSPEQARGETTDFRTDLFSLGSVLYTMCARRPPFAADTVAETLQQVRDAEPAPLREEKVEVPEWLCQVIGKLHAKKACERFASAREVADLLSVQLARLQQSLPPAMAWGRLPACQRPRQAGSLPHGGRPRSKKLLVVLVCLILGAAVLAGVYTYLAWQTSQGSDNQPPDDDGRPSGPVELRRQDIPPHLLALAGGSDPAQAPAELVAVLGDGRFLLPRVGQTGWMVPSPDGHTLAVPLDDDVVLIDVDSGRYKRTFTGPGGKVVWVAFSPDSRLLTATTWHEGFDGSVRVWDLPATREVFTSPVPGYKVSGAATFSADGKRLYAEGKEKIHIWDTQSGQELPSQEIKGGIASMGISPDGRRLAVGLWYGKRVEVFASDDDHLAKIQTLASDDSVGTVAYSPDGKYLASGTPSGFKLWNAETFAELGSVPTPAGQVAFSPDGRTLYAGWTNSRPKSVHTISRWAVDTRQELPPLSVEVSVDPVRAHHGLSRDGKLCFVASAQNATYILAVDTTTGKKRYPSPGHVAPLHCIAVSPDGRTIASAGDDRVVKLWDLSTGRVLHSLATQSDTIYGLAFSPDGKLLASGSKDGTIVLYETPRGSQVHVFHGHSHAPSRIQFSPDGKSLAAGSEGGVVQTWDLASKHQGPVMAGHTGAVRCVAYATDGTRLASGGDDRVVYVHDLAGGQVRKLPAPPGVNDVAFSRDGRLLAAVADGPHGAVRLWHLDNARETTLDGHLSRVNGLAFSPSASLLATCGEDGTVRFWNVEDGALMRTIGPGPFGGSVGAVAFTPDGRYLLTANANGMVDVLRVDMSMGSHSPQ